MNMDAHHRKNIRLKGYDYSQAGLYFITVCTQSQKCLFGNIINNVMVLNEYGEILREEWMKTESIRHDLNMNQFAIMPNHIHGIIQIVECENKADRRRGALHAPFVTSKSNSKTPQQPSQTVGAIIRGIKAAATKRINVLRQTPGEKVWQRNYYDHIIRNEKAYLEISEYIINNPLKWELDKYNNKK